MRRKLGVGHAHVGELGRKYVNEALDAGRLSQGEFVYRFEKTFAELHGQKYGIACSSGTSALHVALEALKETHGWKENSEVLVPAITFIATSNACLHAGLIPVFVDVDPVSYNIDPKRVEEKITANTVAMMPVHTFGQPCEMDELLTISKKYGITMVEDCAEAHFAKYRGQPVGSFGTIAGFSTYVAHTITTGVGGVITTNNQGLAEICRSLIAHGRACTCENCVASDPYAICKMRMQTEMDKRFTMVRVGYSYRIGELEGALGLAQLDQRKFIMDTRRTNAKFLSEHLNIYDKYLQLPYFPEYIEHSFMMYPIVLHPNTPLSRKELVHYLESKHIESRPMLPLINQPIYRKLFGDIEKQYPVADWINNNGFYIGCHHGLDEEDMHYVVNCFEKFFA